MNKHIVLIITAAISAEKFLTGFFPLLKDAGFRITLITSDSMRLRQMTQAAGVNFLPLEMKRTISPFADLSACFRLWRILRQLRPDLVSSGTPKAGLLGSLAAFAANVPVRVFQQRGLRLETATGTTRQILLITERLTAFCATHIVCNSKSLRDLYLQLGMAPASKLIVLGEGSSNGVDIERYHPTRYLTQRGALQTELGLNDEELVIGFFGRLAHDKGIHELVAAFNALPERFASCRLLLVGPLETGDPISTETQNQIQADERIVCVGYVNDLAPYYQLLDILAFLSYREGFPNVLLEAAASEVPVIGFRATGTVDAIADGQTGILVDLGNVERLCQELVGLLDNSDIRNELGHNARQRVVTHFDSQNVRQSWIDFYSQLLEDN